MMLNFFNPRLLRINSFEWIGVLSFLEHSDSHLFTLLLSRFSRVRLCATPQTAAHQAPLSLGFSRQEQWSGLPFPSPLGNSKLL